MVTSKPNELVDIGGLSIGEEHGVRTKARCWGNGIDTQGYLSCMNYERFGLCAVRESYRVQGTYLTRWVPLRLRDTETPKSGQVRKFTLVFELHCRNTYSNVNCKGLLVRKTYSEGIGC
jgi:hypothetical protein